jgi:hypothetical protein
MPMSSFGGEHSVGQIARFVRGGIAVLKSELVAGEPAGVGLELRGPVGHGRLVQQVPRRGVIVHAHFVSKFSAQQY